MLLSRDEVKHIAGLARIGIDDDEIEGYRKDLSAILDYFKELQKLNTDTVEPIGHITGRDTVSRNDERGSAQTMEREGILNNAPERKDNYVKVKSVL